MPRPKNPEIESSILDAAQAELSKIEPEKVTMRQLAKKAGITATTIYYYYKNRQELFEAVKFRYIDELAVFLSSAVPRSGSYIPRIRRLMRAFADWCFANPGPARLIMSRLPANLSPAAETLPRYYRATRAARELVAAAVEAGELRSGDLDLDVSASIGAVWGAVQLTLDHRFEPALWNAGSAVADRAIDIVINGLRGAK
jgi:AcrR family transcriptional regulator